MIRLLVTLLAPLIVWGAKWVILPGIAVWKLPKMVGTEQLSVVALGLLPALSGFVIVELVAAAVPRWRKLRSGGPFERRSLRQAALALTVLLAAVQGGFIARWVHHQSSVVEDPSSLSQLLMTASLIGGSCLILALAWLVDRYGLTSGFSILLAAPVAELIWDAATKIRPNQDLDPFDVALFYTVWLGLAGATVRILGRGGPASGLVPLPVAAGFLTWLPAVLGLLGLQLAFPGPGTPASVALLLVLVVMQTLAFGRRFGARGPSLRASLGYVLFMSVPWLMLLKLPFAIDAFATATAVAVVLDVAAEWRARRKEPTLVDVWPLHDPARLPAAQAALEKAGIFVHARAQRHRRLLQIFGPFVPIDLYVPAARAEEAQEILEEALLAAKATR